MNLKITGVIFIISFTLFAITTAPAILMLNKAFATGIFNKDNNVHIQGGKNIGNIFSTLFGNPNSNNAPTSGSSENYTPHYYIVETHHHCLEGTSNCAFNGGR